MNVSDIDRKERILKIFVCSMSSLAKSIAWNQTCLELDTNNTLKIKIQINERITELSFCYILEFLSTKNICKLSCLTGIKASKERLEKFKNFVHRHMVITLI